MPQGPPTRRRWFQIGLMHLFAILTALTIGLGIFVLFREPASIRKQHECESNLKLIALAMHNYLGAHRSFPPAYLTDAQGTPLVSWRMLIIPYLDGSLPRWYGSWELHRDEPWDGPNNRKLHNETIAHYHCPADDEGRPTDTSYVAIVGPGTMWPGAPMPPESMWWYSQNDTMLIVELKNSGIHWMEPRDLEAVKRAPGVNPRTGVGISSNHRHGAFVCFANGSIRFLENGITEAELRKMVTPKRPSTKSKQGVSA
jgi:hypothetical protein